MIHVLIADDHAIVRFGLKQIITAAFAPVSIFESSTFDDAVELLEQQPFDLLILDINLPGGNGTHMLPVVKRRQAAIKVLIFSALDEQLHAINYLQAGADGYLKKSSEESEIKMAITTVLKNEKYLSIAMRPQWLPGNLNGQDDTSPIAGV